MTYISLILGIVVTRFTNLNAGLAGESLFRWWHRVLSSSASPGKMPPSVFYLMIAVPVVILALGLGLLHRLDWHFLAYIISFLVLLGSFGTGDLRDRIAAYVVDLDREDIQAAYHDAASLGTDEKDVNSWSELHQKTLRSIAWSYFQCYFPVIFWFAVLGAPGALLYRLLCWCQQESEDSAGYARLARMRLMLEWLPLRLLGLALALVGNWQATIQVWLASIRAWNSPAQDVLAGYISAAIHGGSPQEQDTPALEISELEELPLLVDRALITWIAVLGITAVL